MRGCDLVDRGINLCYLSLKVCDRRVGGGEGSKSGGRGGDWLGLSARSWSRG